MKKWIAIFLMVMIVATPAATTMAYALEQPGIVVEPCYNGVDAIVPKLMVDADGMATLTIRGKGTNADTKFHVTSYLEREIDDGLWVRVENGQANDMWTDTVNGMSLYITHTVYTGRDADCRAVISIQITDAGVTDAGATTTYATFY